MTSQVLYSGIPRKGDVRWRVSVHGQSEGRLLVHFGAYATTPQATCRLSQVGRWLGSYWDPDYRWVPEPPQVPPLVLQTVNRALLGEVQ